jgi:hypothetical protein
MTETKMRIASRRGGPLRFSAEWVIVGIEECSWLKTS